jgi:hypothetical protein
MHRSGLLLGRLAEIVVAVPPQFETGAGPIIIGDRYSGDPARATCLMECGTAVKELDGAAD